MKKFNRLVGTLAACTALLFTFTACNNSFSDNSPPPQQLQQGQTQQKSNNVVTYSPEALATPLTFEAAEYGAVITFDNKAAGPVIYKVNGGESQTIASGTSKEIRLANVSDKVEFWGDNKAYATSKLNDYSNIRCREYGGHCFVYGNIMSLVDSVNFKDAKKLEADYTFAHLFEESYYMKNKDGVDLLLPATTLTERCYYSMFDRCQSLTASPVLPAPTLVKECYFKMFDSCSNLSYVTCLASDGFGDSGTHDWLYRIANYGTFIKAKGVTFPLTRIGLSWTVEDYNPGKIVPLTLEAAAAGVVVTFDNKATGPVTYKVNDGESQTIANGETGTITLGNVGDKVEFFGDNKFYATGYDNYSNIACSKDCYLYGNIMSLIKSAGFDKVTELGEQDTFMALFYNNTNIKNKTDSELLLPATKLANGCYGGMFSGCKKLTVAPNLPATGLRESCYRSMFKGCENLSSVTCLAKSISASDCTTDWLDGVAASGTFTKAAGADWSGKTGASGIPSVWNVVEK